ncbi:glycosyl transferase family protein [Inquilinus limosus]|uniref:glycosyl transferase family protein n=1 Tax=Inquilinus limosus TaxID=171674 RepID=UPI00040BD5AD|nr:glycosyl transferase family protein [Inquilinus limosus]
MASDVETVTATPDSPPRQRMAAHLAAIGRGPGRSRPLTEAEAEDAFAIILAGEADPMQVGAFLLLERYRGETAAELAGMIRAARAAVTAAPATRPDLDWPSYAAGKTRGAPWFLLSALLVARAGHPVLMHGINVRITEGIETEDAVRALGLPVPETPAEAARILDGTRFVYLPLRAVSRTLTGLMELRPVLGLRSPVNSAARLLNPFEAKASFVGVFHPAYQDLHRDTARLLGQRDLCVVKGAGGEAERTPLKALALQRLVAGEALDETVPPIVGEGRGERLERRDLEHFRAVWTGAAEDPAAEATVIGTAAVALAVIAGDRGEAAHARHLEQAAALWQERNG